MQAHRLRHEGVEIAEELVDRVVGRVVGNHLGQRLTEDLCHFSLQIPAYAQALVDELIGTQARVFDDVIVIAVVNDIHLGRLLGVQQHCAGCTTETLRTSEVAHSLVIRASEAASSPLYEQLLRHGFTGQNRQHSVKSCAFTKEHAYDGSRDRSTAG